MVPHLGRLKADAMTNLYKGNMLTVVGMKGYVLEITGLQTSYK